MSSIINDLAVLKLVTVLVSRHNAIVFASFNIQPAVWRGWYLQCTSADLIRSLRLADVRATLDRLRHRSTTACALITKLMWRSTQALACK